LRIEVDEALPNNIQAHMAELGLMNTARTVQLQVLHLSQRIQALETQQRELECVDPLAPPDYASTTRGSAEMLHTIDPQSM